MQSPRIGLVFWLWQCDKENHGWREGPPLTVVLAREFRSVEGLHPPDKPTRTKEEYCLPPVPATPLTLRDWPVYCRLPPTNSACESDCDKLPLPHG